MKMNSLKLFLFQLMYEQHFNDIMVLWDRGYFFNVKGNTEKYIFIFCFVEEHFLNVPIYVTLLA